MFAQISQHFMKKLRTVLGNDGRHLSPQLPDEIRNFLIDIDGTVTDDVPNEEPERMATCIPYPDALEQVNKWYSDGRIITFFTSRTEAQRLQKHNFQYHYVLMNKPKGGNYHWIDNHMVRAT